MKQIEVVAIIHDDEDLTMHCFGDTSDMLSIIEKSEGQFC